ncbi:MAG: hypothetical protein HZB51_27885 [Chloroflexi bacterium]|nr:hypothetical protein [Chloroflexota bacterium]
MNLPAKILFATTYLLIMLGVACAPTPTATPVPPSPTAIPPTVPPVLPTATPMPLAFNFPKGATWTYQGVVQWDDKGKAQKQTLTWKMQIVDKIERSDGIVGYVMKGHPSDLAFYTVDKQPGDYLYLAKANRVYEVTLIDTKPIERVKAKNDALTDLLVDDNLVFDFPLAANKKFGSAQFVADPSGMNVWVITNAQPATLSGIKGITPSNATEYVLEFKTNPDRQTVYHVPNVGTTRFVYHHNGTLSEVDVKLIEYNPSGTASVAPTGPCELVASKELTAYTRPSTQAAVFGKVAASERLPVGGMTADGWIGFDPGVAQAANIGPFRFRWVQKNDAVKLEGACDKVATIASLSPTACFQMFMDATKIYSAANKSSAVIVTAKPEDYAQVIAANDKWLHLDLNVGSLKQAKQGWIDRADVNFNGPCDKLPVAK